MGNGQLLHTLTNRISLAFLGLVALYALGFLHGVTARWAAWLLCKDGRELWARIQEWRARRKARH